jgi:hypothetical protein
MAEIQAINVADAATAISAMMAPEQGQAEVDEAQPAEVSDEDTEAAASGDDDSGVEDAQMMNPQRNSPRRVMNPRSKNSHRLSPSR